jgi:hypothetical protein
MIGEPVFIVGAPRSGTTLLAAVLAAHSRLSCGPETHFFRRLASVDATQLVEDKRWPETAVTFITSISHSGFTGHESKQLLEKYQLDPTAIVAYLQARPPSIPAILGSITEQYMHHQGKQRWVEKTPDHLLHLPLIRRYFPNAPIVRIMRDPRDVALSLTKVPWGAKSFLEALLFWRKWDDASQTFFTDDSCSYTLHFEALMAAPQDEVQKLSAFIGEKFEENMLDTSQTARDVNSRNVPWKANVGKPFDASRAGAWRTDLTLNQVQLAEALLGDRLTAYGYPIASTFSALAEVYPSLDLATRYEAGLQQVVAQGVRFWPLSVNEPTRARVFLGDPAYDGWLGQDRKAHFQVTSRLSTRIMKAALSGSLIFWLQDRLGEEWSGYGAFILRRLLKSYLLIEEPH